MLFILVSSVRSYDPQLRREIYPSYGPSRLRLGPNRIPAGRKYPMLAARGSFFRSARSRSCGWKLRGDSASIISLTTLSGEREVD